MDQVVGNITNNISFVLSNINALKNLFLEENSIENYNTCNDLRINFKKFYQEILEQISGLDDAIEYDFSLVAVQYRQIKSDFDRLENSNKSIIKNTINSISKINELFEFLITQQQKIPLDKEQMSDIQNQIMCFKYDILY